jgi:hypothetical protein
MFSGASDPVCCHASRQAVLFYLFYLYSAALIAWREHLPASGVRGLADDYPDPMPKAEMRFDGPDGRRY